MKQESGVYIPGEFECPPSGQVCHQSEKHRCVCVCPVSTLVPLVYVFAGVSPLYTAQMCEGVC